MGAQSVGAPDPTGGAHKAAGIDLRSGWTRAPQGRRSVSSSVQDTVPVAMGVPGSSAGCWLLSRSGRSGSLATDSRAIRACS